MSSMSLPSCPQTESNDSFVMYEVFVCQDTRLDSMLTCKLVCLLGWFHRAA
jgi:hypothetical protein